jgi:hypothetical protein
LHARVAGWLSVFIVVARVQVITHNKSKSRGLAQWHAPVSIMQRARTCTNKAEFQLRKNARGLNKLCNQPLCLLNVSAD